jgi:hypothetical protein
VNSLLGDWTVVGLQSYASGTPILINQSTSVIPTFGSIWVNRIPGVPIRTDVSCSTYDPNNPARNKFLNAGAFVAPQPFALGNTNVLDSVRTCGVKSEHLSIVKDFSKGERYKVRFGVDFINAFN